MYALQANHISKIFRMYNRPVDRLKELFFRKAYHRQFAALKDVSLAVSLWGDAGNLWGTTAPAKSHIVLQDS